MDSGWSWHLEGENESNGSRILMSRADMRNVGTDMNDEINIEGDEKQPFGVRFKGWPVIVALVVVLLLDLFFLSSLTLVEHANKRLSVTEIIVYSTIIFAIVLLAIISWLTKHYRLTRTVIIVSTAFVTLDLIGSVVALVLTLHWRNAGLGGLNLLWDSAVVWVTNLIVFGIWYWLIDSGGPLKRATGDVTQVDFAFPQQTEEYKGWKQWQPGFFDYLFLAFNTNTDFSVGETIPLSRRAKALMMTQAVISLVIIVTIAARAIGILA